MTENLAILLVEENPGQFAIQLYSSPDKALELFNQLKGKPADKKTKATIITLDWIKNIVEAYSKELPELKPNPDSSWKLGTAKIQ
jgi:hypothetical protein